MTFHLGGGFGRVDALVAESDGIGGANRALFARDFALTGGDAIRSTAKVVVASFCEALCTEELATTVAEA